MKRSSSLSTPQRSRLEIRRPVPQPTLSAIFAGLPGMYLVVTPDMRVVAASDRYLNATLTRMPDIAGRGLFEVFPDNPTLVEADGVLNLRSSFSRVLESGKADTMPVQRYDVRNQQSRRGEWVEKYWSPVNSPVFGSGSREITHIIHRVEDVTEVVKLRQQLESERLIGKEFRTELEGLEFDLYLRARELQHANDKLRRALRELGRSVGMESLSVWRYVEIFDHLLYCVPGDAVPRSGIYELVHSDRFGDGCYKSKVVLRLGERFPVCHYCGTRVRYRLLYPAFGKGEHESTTGTLEPYRADPSYLISSGRKPIP